MKIIQKRLNNTYIRKNDLRNCLSRSKEKDKTINYINNNIENKINIIGNINTNRSYNKTKLIKKNKKVKFSIPINLKNNKSNYTNNNKFNNKNNSTIINTNINNHNHNITTNLKKNIIHRHTKSSFIQGSNLLLNKITKDISITNINNNLYNNEFRDINVAHKKKNSLNDFSNNDTRMSVGNIISKKITNKTMNKPCNNNKIKKFKNIPKQTKEKKNYINNNKYPTTHNIKDGLSQIIEELNTSKKSNVNNNGLSKKFIEAQNNWRKNYFALVIQRIYRGYLFRKKFKNSSMGISISKKNKSGNINNAVYIKKKIKDNNLLYNSVAHHKEYPTEGNIIFNRDNKVPHKIKEIVISMKSNKQQLNDDNLYYNNYMLFNVDNNLNYFSIKYAFNIWKEYSDKISILKKLKIYKKYKKTTFRKSSYEKRRSNNRYKI